jgi:MFS family permease
MGSALTRSATVAEKTRHDVEERSHSRLRWQLPCIYWEGALANVFIVLTGGVFITGLALLLGASDFEIGVLGAIPFLAQVTQLPAAYFIDRWGNRKRITVWASVAARQIWWLAIPLLLWGWSGRLTLFLTLLAISSVAIMIATPGWLAWMADVVPGRLRGRVFGARAAAVAVSTVTTTVIGGVVLDHFRASGQEQLAFMMLIAVACSFALISVFLLRRVDDPTLMATKVKVNVAHLLEPLRSSRFRHLLKVFFLWNIAIGVSAVFFAPHMLTNLKMSFTQVSLYASAVSLSAVLLNKPWGKLIDRFGSRPVIAFSALGIALIPIVWLLPRPDFLWILAIEAIYTGALWAGFNLAAFNMPIACSPRGGRTAYLAVFSVVTGMAFFVASLAGGILAELWQPVHWQVGSQTVVNYHLLFAVSAILRVLAAFLFLSFHEPNEKRTPVMIQFMGYAFLRRLAVGRQLLPAAISKQTKPVARTQPQREVMR